MTNDEPAPTADLAPIPLADRVRRACIQAALDAYEDAGVRGLCAEGRWELAIEAIRGLELGKIVEGEGDERPEREGGSG